MDRATPGIAIRVLDRKADGAAVDLACFRPRQRLTQNVDTALVNLLGGLNQFDHLFLLANHQASPSLRLACSRKRSLRRIAGSYRQGRQTQISASTPIIVPVLSIDPSRQLHITCPIPYNIAMTHWLDTIPPALISDRDER